MRYRKINKKQKIKMEKWMEGRRKKGIKKVKLRQQCYQMCILGMCPSTQ
jgi:hypothetical protein